jgi:hypothetical protein
MICAHLLISAIWLTSISIFVGFLDRVLNVLSSLHFLCQRTLIQESAIHQTSFLIWGTVLIMFYRDECPFWHDLWNTYYKIHLFVFNWCIYDSLFSIFLMSYFLSNYKGRNLLLCGIIIFFTQSNEYSEH